jgi:phenylacetate-CoA ligase
MASTFMPKIAGEDELRELQLRGLQWTVKHAYENSEFYRKQFDRNGVKPGDVRKLEDIVHFPFVSSKDLAEGYPFPLRAVPFDKIVRIHASSGTTGKRKILSYTQKDVDDWATMFARCYEMAGLTQEDRVQNCNAYGLWTAGVGFQWGCEKFGAMLIPVGTGNIDIQFTMMEDLQSTVLLCTASMALLLAEEIARRNVRDKIAVKKMIFGSERHSEAMDKKIKELSGAEHIFDIVGLTELYGPGTGIDCPKHEGIHYWADYYLLEVINPETLQPVAPGEVGEMVLTTLRKEAAPLVRYRTHDLTRLIPTRCSCGSILPMHDKLLGRSDDMFIFRAVNIYPGQIDHILSSIDEIGSEYQILLDREADGKDYMLLKVERGRGINGSRDQELGRRIESAIKKQILVSAKVEIAGYGSLPRSERKSKRVFDNRQ